MKNTLYQSFNKENHSKRIFSKNTDKLLGEYRRVQTNVDESQTNVHECR